MVCGDPRITRQAKPRALAIQSYFASGGSLAVPNIAVSKCRTRFLARLRRPTALITGALFIQSLLKVLGTYCFGFAVVTWLPMACEITSRPVVTLMPEVATVTLGVTWTLR